MSRNRTRPVSMEALHEIELFAEHSDFIFVVKAEDIIPLRDALAYAFDLAVAKQEDGFDFERTRRLRDFVQSIIDYHAE